MLTYYTIIHVLILGAQFLSAVSINGFIVVVNAVGFIRKRQISPLDLLVSCLVTSRICMQVFAFILPLAFLFSIEQSVFRDLTIFVTFVNILAHWLATWLGVFYCVKIATITHPLFVWLKMKISKLVPGLILGSTVYAAIGTGITRNYIWAVTEKFWGDFFFSNETSTESIDIAPLSLLILYIIVPSIIFLVAALLLTFSLGRHAWKMRTTAMGTEGPCFSAPLKAMLSILSFLFLYFSYYGSSILFSTQDVYNGRISILFWHLLCGSYPCIHSGILILGNAKLKKNAKKFLRCCQWGQ